MTSSTDRVALGCAISAKDPMNESEHDPDQVLCYCSGTTRQQLTDLIQKGVDNIDRLSRITGACSGCGGCEYELTQLIAAESKAI